jgi:hypothetical protein
MTKTTERFTVAKAIAGHIGVDQSRDGRKLPLSTDTYAMPDIQ